MAKKQETEIDPKMLDAKDVPYPCTGCSLNGKPCSYKYCDRWKTWFRVKWREVTSKLKRKE